MITETFEGKTFTQGSVNANYFRGNRRTITLVIGVTHSEHDLEISIGDASDLIECLQAALKEAL